MRYLLGVGASVLLVPLWYAMSGGPVPAILRERAFGIPVATLFVLLEMAVLVLLCWYAMKAVAPESPETDQLDVGPPSEMGEDHN